MTTRVLIELALFLFPFAMFGLYRLIVADAAESGRKTWPITSLFAIGAALAIAAWVFMIFREDRVRELCPQPARFVDGELVPGGMAPCDPDLEEIGIPRSDLDPNADAASDAGSGAATAPSDEASRDDG